MEPIRLDEIDKLFPTCLDEVVPRNRHLLNVRLASVEEMKALVGGIEEPHAVARGKLDRWHVITLVSGYRVVSQNLLAFIDGGQAWVTSTVKTIDRERGKAQTRNSIYLLGTEPDGEPNREQCIMLGMALVHWGLNGRLDLGIPYFP